MNKATLEENSSGHKNPFSISRPAAGIYIHWPFCERKCPYCDFYTFGREHPFTSQTERYADSLLREIESKSFNDLLSSERPLINSLYFGGGTPSLMGAAVCER